jgi:FMN phosphatase YigB (HAD superfamily)
MKLLGLDVGGVLLRSPWELLSEQYPHLPELLPGVFGPLSRGRDALYADFQAGRVSETDYWIYFSDCLVRHTCEFRGSDNPVRTLITASRDPVRAGLRQWLSEFASDGGQIFTFSNGLYRNMGKAWAEAHLPMDLVCGHFDASETKIRKQDERSFAPLLDRMHLHADCATLYVDDNPYYVLVAERAGIPGIVFWATEEERSIALISSFFEG